MSLQINWDAVAADAGYKDGRNAKVMYGRLVTALKKTKAVPTGTASRKPPRGRKPAKGGNAGQGGVKKGKRSILPSFSLNFVVTRRITSYPALNIG